MNSIAIEVKVSPELVQALNNLADAMRGQTVPGPAAPTGQTLAPAPVAPVTPIAPAPAPVPVAAPAAPVQPAPVAPAVPLAAAPSFTVEQVGTAGAELLREHPEKMQDLLALLQQFGVPTVQALKPEQAGTFATALRGLGAKI